MVASTNSDPLSTFTSLANQQVSQQQQFPNKLPRWFCQGILHYYVLLHDVVDSEQSRYQKKKLSLLFDNSKFSSSAFEVVCHIKS